MAHVKRSFTLSRHRTSVALEPEFWAALERLAAGRGQTLLGLIAQADATRAPSSSLASLLRVAALTGQTPDRPGAEPFA